MKFKIENDLKKCHKIDLFVKLSSFKKKKRRRNWKYLNNKRKNNKGKRNKSFWFYTLKMSCQSFDLNINANPQEKKEDTKAHEEGSNDGHEKLLENIL